jgi:hypothetical protein
MMRDLLGNEISNEEALRILKRKAPQPNGYAQPPGSGPKGETCKTCKHLARIRYSKTYLKCALIKEGWTHGTGTDVKAKAPACRLWEAAE